jgi:CP family cyanate transporter-like MFS transporter
LTAGLTEGRADRPFGIATPLHAGLVAALFLAALSLRPQLVGAGPLIPAIEAELRLSHATAGLIGTIPVLCMGIFAPIAPFAAARLVSGTAIAASIALIGGFGLGRVLATDAVVIFALTVGVGVGMGIAGALLPVYVKERMGASPVLGTVAYSSGLQLGSAVSGALAVPLALALGGWRAALGAFSAVTLLLLVPWVALGLRRTREPARRIQVGRRDFADGRGWMLAGVFALFGVVYYGLIAWLVDAYLELGWTPVAAGGLIGLLNLGALAGAVTIGLFAGRVVSHRKALGLLGAIFAIATAGLAAAPVLAPAWAAIAGYANGALFPLVLALPLRLAASPDRVAGLSSVMLGGGYTIAALSPVVLGAVRDVTGTFRASLSVVVLAALVFAVGLVIVARLPESPREGGHRIPRTGGTGPT